ncbi:Trehalose transport system permease protein SugB [Thermoflexales bacterium]|nr:Trehalose transport system permease protein SugB [Thermoflexales bacterium]
MRKLKWWQQLWYQLGFVLIALFVIVPIWGMAQMAFDASVRGWPTEFRLIPREFTLDVFRAVWERPAQTLSFLGTLQNSLFVAGGAALIAVSFGASLAYAFARLRFPGQQIGLFALLLGALLPPVALMTPLYILLSAVGLRTTLVGIMIVYAAISMPLCVWNMRAAFQAVPKEIEEAAFIDGATAWQTFWRVTLRLAMPSIGVAALIAFLIGYSEFAIGWLFVDKPGNVTLAMAISNLQRQIGTASWSHLAAAAIMMSLPVVIVFVVLQKYLLRGSLFGAVDE